MRRDLNSVKTKGGGYHHGTLPSALIAAASEIIEESGLDTFSLRAAARRAGVSPAAPAHHFGDTRGLLTAVATRSFSELAVALEVAVEDDRKSTAFRQADAYLGFALARPGLFRLMWRSSLLDQANADYLAAARRAFGASALANGRDLIVALQTGDHDVAAPMLGCWSMVHGFTMMVLDGALFGSREDPPEKSQNLLRLLLSRLDLGTD